MVHPWPKLHWSAYNLWVLSVQRCKVKQVFFFFWTSHRNYDNWLLRLCLKIQRLSDLDERWQVTWLWWYIAKFGINWLKLFPTQWSIFKVSVPKFWYLLTYTGSCILGVGSEKIGVTELNFLINIFKLGVFYYSNKVEVQKFSNFFRF
jgi:hypothetical protein